MAWITTYILISIVGFYALLSLFLLARMAKVWLKGPAPRERSRHPSLPHWTPPAEVIAPKNQEQSLSL